jgi:hypothetical protein
LTAFLALQTEQLRLDFETRAENQRVALEAESNTLGIWTSDILKEHNKTLRSFEDIAARVDKSEQDDFLAERAESLSVTLGNLQAQEVHCRLDRLYLENILEGSVDERRELSPEEKSQLDSLEAEISSLNSELDVLAEMSSRQGFDRLFSQALQHTRDVSNFTSAKQLDSVGFPGSAMCFQRLD